MHLYLLALTLGLSTDVLKVKTLAEVRRELIAEERAASSVAASSANVLSNLDAAPDMSMAGFVMVGIDIEDAQ